jgi:hypothetical protein
MSGIPTITTFSNDCREEGTRQLFHHMGLTNKDVHNKPKNHFFDLGSGGGRLVIQSFLELPSVVKSVGIELSPSRHAIAADTWKELVRSGDAGRVRQLAENSWGMTSDKHILSNVDLHEGDLFGLDISEATHIYIASLCFSDDMLIRLVDKIENEGSSLEIVATLRPFPLQDVHRERGEARTKHFKLGDNPWIEYIEMSWTKARWDGCPVYFYSVKASQ